MVKLYYKSKNMTLHNKIISVSNIMHYLMSLHFKVISYLIDAISK